MRWRNWGSIIGLILFLFVVYPIQMTAAALFLGLLYFVCTRILTQTTIQDGKKQRREEALRIARIYLAPYKSIWNNLKLSNKVCSLKLSGDGQTIYGTELVSPYRQFKIISTQVHSWSDLWDMFCKAFNHNTTYDGLVKKCSLYRVTIKENWQEQNKIPEQKPVSVNKVDINNASEVELTALPGISIVMSKKLIKKREEIGGFKSVDDVFLFLHLKEHMQGQLKDLICVNEMKGYTRIERSAERKIDL